jgi:hypothetical protein
MKQKKPSNEKPSATQVAVLSGGLTPPSGWNFHERVDRSTGVITEWIASENFSIKTRANFDRAIDQLRHQPKRSWSKPNPASKIGNHTYVIRFNEVSSKQLRLFGHFFDEHGSFVMTMEGYEKDNVYYPKKYESLAEAYRVLCDKDFHLTTRSFENTCSICGK